MLLYLLLTSFLAGRALGAACLQDNLLRAFIQSSIPAASFCATYTKGLTARFQRLLRRPTVLPDSRALALV